ncbi:S8 family serine peptidase [Actinoplanes sp. GCM10030250]|uniref:S8 family peptidase n=1 Tax=Actinoplanes sp. GCM10030250 TaxID=3273376 RepID=UPI0036235219
MVLRAAVSGLTLLALLPITAGPSATDYTVVAADGVAASDVTAAVRSAGGRIVSRNDTAGVYRVTSADARFAAKATASAALIGASERRAIARVAVEPAGHTAGGTGGARGPEGLDPLDNRLWGLRMIRADQARKVHHPLAGVTVGVLDTGLDAGHPDLAPHFNRALSRNFAPDIAAVDGPCEVKSCLDPVGTDDGGHGTHVAGTIGAAADGFGLSGVAPGVSLVELKGGQDSGFFFLDSVVNALTYAGDAGIDVVNMSFYVDPWKYLCEANPADSAKRQAEQRAILVGLDRALEYAHRKGVTLISSLGNSHEDLGRPLTDRSSPNYGAEPYERKIDNATCRTMPQEGPHVLNASSLGPSGRKAEYSNYGVEQISVAAPGGDLSDWYGTDKYQTTANEILSSYPKHVLQEQGMVDAEGRVTRAGDDSVVRHCSSGTCGYYMYAQGTSMASPHAAGVAALIVSRYGKADPARAGRTMDPDAVERTLLRTAAQRPCPPGRVQSYQREGQPAEYDARCEGGRGFNGFYGHGIVDAYAAVGGY